MQLIVKTYSDPVIFSLAPLHVSNSSTSIVCKCWLVIATFIIFGLIFFDVIQIPYESSTLAATCTNVTVFMRMPSHRINLFFFFCVLIQISDTSIWFSFINQSNLSPTFFYHCKLHGILKIPSYTQERSLRFINDSRVV